ncbi:MAG: ubiquitin-conjugating enzyme E2 variant [Candidatus Heimdallarchaeota archaeon]
MSENPDLIIAQELDWIMRNEPTFSVNGNQFIGKVGRAPDGEDIIISIIVPEYYPFIKPEVKVVTNISHPNINPDRILDLQLLDMWEPNYRMKDIITSTRRLFVKSSKSISIVSAPQVAPSRSEQEIVEKQNEIAEYNKKINELKAAKLKNAGVNSIAVGSMQISRKFDLECQILALNDLVELLEVKFEEAEIDQTDFFRLYRRYRREGYIQSAELNKLIGEKNDYIKKTQRPITN